MAPTTIYKSIKSLRMDLYEQKLKSWLVGQRKSQQSTELEKVSFGTCSIEVSHHDLQRD